MKSYVFRGARRTPTAEKVKSSVNLRPTDLIFPVPKVPWVCGWPVECAQEILLELFAQIRTVSTAFHTASVDGGLQQRPWFCRPRFPNRGSSFPTKQRQIEGKKGVKFEVKRG